ncbi:MAG: excinuclease ABC subunit UvrC [Gammaproteobacteria bacterium]|nr:excinuclease ABC subunit UvrC [Gammaproteobacteria bacterium]
MAEDVTTEDLTRRLRRLSRSLPERPGVYRMLDAQGTMIYVGKAVNLKRRVTSYFTRGNADPKQQAMVRQVADFEFTVTATETEAYLLENNLIKEHRPRYNILLRDDKSYPYIHISGRHPYPRISVYRGTRSLPGRFFGPYPNASAVRQTLQLLQKLFRVRQCEDSYFANRSRPCLLYQIARCSAPCVDRISAAEYAADLRDTVRFLEGRSQAVIESLTDRMDQAAREQRYEQAALLRDRIVDLRGVQQLQPPLGGSGDCDIVTVRCEGDVGCVQVLFVRNSLNLGNKTFSPTLGAGCDPDELLTAFLTQYYLAARPERRIPVEIIVDRDFAERDSVTAALSEHAGHTIRIRTRVRGARRHLLDLARSNTELVLRQRLASSGDHQRRLEALREVLSLERPLQRIECFDISHTGGERPVASCVVFDREGPCRSDYRRFNITAITAGDDYAAMRQAVQRRYTRLRDEGAALPDLLLIDGGSGQVRMAQEALDAIPVSGITVIGVAKGPARRPGQESLVMHDVAQARRLAPESPALLVIQRIRDEAHRFAITGHRAQRSGQRRQSVLTAIPGIGDKRRRQLIRQFGGLQGVVRAGVEELAAVEGISRQLAERIYAALHNEP